MSVHAMDGSAKPKPNNRPEQRRDDMSEDKQIEKLKQALQDVMSVIDVLTINATTDDLAELGGDAYAMADSVLAKLRTQRYICKRCKSSAHDDDGAYCDKFDLCLEFAPDGYVITANGSDQVICDGTENRINC